MLRRRSLAVVGVLAASCSLTGCGSSSHQVSAAAYVKSVCTTIGAFETDIGTRSSALNLGSIKNPVQGKTALEGLFSVVATDTNTALTRLRHAGAPDVSGGGKIASAIVQAFVQLQTEMKAAATTAHAMPTTSSAAFQQAADTLGNTVRNSVNGMGSSLNGLTSAKLEKAALNEPACSRLSSTS